MVVQGREMTEKSRYEERIRHVESHVFSEFNAEMNESAVKKILTGADGLSRSIRTLERRANAMAVYECFVNRNAKSAKDWFFTLSNLQLKRLSAIDRRERHAAFTSFDGSSSAFSGDTRTQIEMGAILSSLYQGQSVEPNLQFITEQEALIFQGISQGTASRNLIEASEILKNDLLSLDVELFVKLKSGTDDEIRGILLAICDESENRFQLESGFTEGLMNTPATYYMKLVHMTGRDISLEHPMLPMELVKNENEQGRVFKFPELKDVVIAEL